MSKDGLLLISGRSGEYMRNAVVNKLCEYMGKSDPDELTGHVNAKDFNNGEIFAQLVENHRGQEIHLFQSFHAPLTDSLTEKVMGSNLDYETYVWSLCFALLKKER